MITFLAKLIIKNRENTSDPDVRRKYGFLCGTVGILLNILLFAGKLLAGVISGSIAIMADAFNNLSDAGSSLITLLGFKLAGQKPDTEHPFGHGRFEYISGFVVAIAIILVGFELAKSSVEKIINPEVVEFSTVTMVILIVSIVVKLYMALYNRRIGVKINSAAMRATSTDSMGDSIATFVVLAAMIVSKYTGVNIDGWCGILVALFILYAGYKAAKETIGPLLGQPPEPEFVKEIEEIVMAHNEIAGIHDLIVHDYGPGRLMISLHAEVPADGDIMEMHDVVDNIETELKNKLSCHAVIHMDPIATNDETVINTKNRVAEIVRAIDENITIHDFRMVKGKTHTNLIFDVVVPYSIKIPDSEVEKKVKELIKTENKNYNAVVQIEKNYV